MAEYKYTCPWCRKQLPASKGKKVGARVYHVRCYDEKIQQELEKQQRKKDKEITKVRKEEKEKVIEIPKAVSEDEAQSREHFFGLVKKLTGNKVLSAKTYVLADRYKKEYKFTWEGMEKTLIFTYQLNESPIGDEIIGIIPWRYTEANEFYDSLEDIKPVEESLEDLYKKRKVKIRPKYNEAPSIDISQLGE